MKRKKKENEINAINRRVASLIIIVVVASYIYLLFYFYKYYFSFFFSAPSNIPAVRDWYFYTAVMPAAATNSRRI